MNSITRGLLHFIIDRINVEGKKVFLPHLYLSDSKWKDRETIRCNDHSLFSTPLVLAQWLWSYSLVSHMTDEFVSPFFSLLSTIQACSLLTLSFKDIKYHYGTELSMLGDSP